MEIQDFADVTYQVLRDTPLEKYIPTLCLPERGEIHALQGVPAKEEDRIRDHALSWAQSTARDGEEFLVAFRDGEKFFRIIRRADGELREALFPGLKNA